MDEEVLEEKKEVDTILTDIFQERGISNIIIEMKQEMEDLTMKNSFVFTEPSGERSMTVNYRECHDSLISAIGVEEYNSLRREGLGIMMMCVAFLLINRKVITKLGITNSRCIFDNITVTFYDEKMSIEEVQNMDHSYIEYTDNKRPYKILSNIFEHRVSIYLYSDFKHYAETNFNIILKYYKIFKTITNSFTRFTDKALFHAIFSMSKKLLMKNPGEDFLYEVDDMFNNDIRDPLYKFFNYIMKRSNCADFMKFETEDMHSITWW